MQSELKKAYKEKFEELEESLRRYDPERNTFYYFKKRDYQGNFEEYDTLCTQVNDSGGSIGGQ